MWMLSEYKVKINSNKSLWYHSATYCISIEIIVLVDCCYQVAYWCSYSGVVGISMLHQRHTSGIIWLWMISLAVVPVVPDDLPTCLAVSLVLLLDIFYFYPFMNLSNNNNQPALGSWFGAIASDTSTTPGHQSLNDTSWREGHVIELPIGLVVLLLNIELANLADWFSGQNQYRNDRLV
jgi:hypothetical protein